MTERDLNTQRAESPPRAAQPGAGRGLPRGGKRADPTAPEVPSAKRVLAVRHRRSLWFVAAGTLILLSVIVYLMFKTGQRVTAMPNLQPSSSREAGIQAEVPAVREEVTPARGNDPPVPPGPDEESPHRSVPPATAPKPKPAPQSKDIFRKPAF